MPEIDEDRATAVLVRQSKDGADTAQAESRETQLGLQDYAKLLYRRKAPEVRLYDEKSGVSGQKRIDERKKLDELYRDMNKGIIGQVVMAREDRLFRNKHMDQVGVFTKLAEEKKIKIIVPPISSAASDYETRVYDFTIYQDLLAFQEKMREAYAYIAGPIKHANQCKQNKADKGGFDGRWLPPGFAVKGKKENQHIVVYEPWAKEIRKLALRAQALSWNLSKLNREIAGKAFLLPEIPEEDKERYMFRTKIHHIPGVGYKPRGSETLKNWLTNEMYIGWWVPNAGKPDTIIDHHDAILDYALFAEGYAAITGFTLEGEPVERARGVTRLRAARETPPDALFYGRLSIPQPAPGRNTFTTIDAGNYVAKSMQSNGLVVDKLFIVPQAPLDTIVIERLEALKSADRTMNSRVKETLEQVYDQQADDFVSIHEQLRGIELQLAENAEKRLETSKKDPLYARLQKQADELLAIQEQLEAKKDKLGMIDSPEEIERLHSLLGNFEEVWPTFDLEQRQRAFTLLINRIEVELVSPHWLRLSIDWLDAVCPRIDVAYVWKVSPGRANISTISDWEAEIVRQYYRTTPRLEIQQLLPDRTWQSIRWIASLHGVKREQISVDSLPLSIHVCYRDLVPKGDGQYLFGTYETTLDIIRTACASTGRASSMDRKGCPLYPIWLLSEKVEDNIPGLFEGTLNPMATAI